MRCRRATCVLEVMTTDMALFEVETFLRTQFCRSGVNQI